MKAWTTTAVVGAVLLTSAGIVDAKDRGHHRGESDRGRHELRQDRNEIRQDRREIREDRRAMREARESGDRAAFVRARRELLRDQAELRRDLAELRRAGFDRDREFERDDDRHGPPFWAPAWGWRRNHDMDGERADARFDRERSWWEPFWRGWR